jgi:hypothetical protein
VAERLLSDGTAELPRVPQAPYTRNVGAGL